MALLQDPILGYRVGAHDAARVYDAAHAPKNKVSLQGPLRKVYSILNVYGTALPKYYLNDLTAQVFQLEEQCGLAPA